MFIATSYQAAVSASGRMTCRTGEAAAAQYPQSIGRAGRLGRGPHIHRLLPQAHRLLPQGVCGRSRWICAMIAAKHPLARKALPRHWHVHWAAAGSPLTRRPWKLPRAGEGHLVLRYYDT